MTLRVRNAVFMGAIVFALVYGLDLLFALDHPIWFALACGLVAAILQFSKKEAV